MSIKERKDREKLERRNSILAAAADLFWEKGYEATMDEIAERADLSKPTLYLYFRNKDDLYASIAINGFDDLKETFAGITRGGGDVESKVRAMYRAFIKHVLDNKQVVRITEFVESERGRSRLSREISDKVSADISELLSFATGVLQQGIDEGVFTGGMDPLVASIILWRSILGVATLAIEEALPDRDEEFFDHLFESTIVILLEGIRKR